MPTYFGYQDESGDSFDGANAGYSFACLVTCPGSGNQIVKELSGYVKSWGGPYGNMRLAIYSADGSTKICEGTEEVEVSNVTVGWVGHSQVNITPNPATLVGGTDYYLVYSFDLNDTLQHFIGSGTTKYRGSEDHADGFPSSILFVGWSTFTDRSYNIRCGVDPAGTIHTVSCGDGIAIGEGASGGAAFSVSCVDGLKSGGGISGTGNFPASILEGFKTGDVAGAASEFLTSLSDGIRIGDSLFSYEGEGRGGAVATFTAKGKTFALKGNPRQFHFTARNRLN